MTIHLTFDKQLVCYVCGRPVADDYVTHTAKVPNKPFHRECAFCLDEDTAWASRLRHPSRRGH